MKEVILTTMALMPFHFVGDWALQSTYVAMNKATNWKLRAWHVFIYTCIIALGFLTLDLPVTMLILLGIYIPHYLIDSYKPVKWWVYNIQLDNHAIDVPMFKKSFENPRQLLMYIVLDQTFHFLCLLALVAQIQV